MKPEEFALSLQKKYDKFGSKIINDTTTKGERFCEIVYQNEHLPALPITLTIFEDGALVSFGNMSNVTGDKRLSYAAATQAIDDILSDKIIFVFCYADREKQNYGRLCDSYVFALTGDGDDMSVEYEKFIKTIKKPLGKFSRLFSPLKGIFCITNFSGSVSFEAER